ncbi:C4-dicarboxylate ABC transporter permease [Alcanivorax sp. P2S70]|uniref:TRAP transporter small permease protein n=1 Tax=Alcanivorax profundi TaxID=2338368 RepID=A0A418XVE7_9GAMM|nr:MULTISPECIES: TRAP transporter small permease [Alcanivorax]ERP93048.1 C4-dicarboxylate ABC transporter permease [Alcanivorax sp. P2S70]RJG16717.1 TRAP transporter small permease [Alcanivorax profundi]|tara:strand:+ start:839 stop:1345 length:507 start_codon:yes stop_codon:yes gene_type:complete
MAGLLRGLHRFLHQLEDGLIVAVLLFMILLAVAQIILRNFFGTSLIWIEPLLQNAVLWIGLLGAMIASRNDEHIRIDVASALLPEKYHPFLTVAVDLFTAFICVLVAWYSVGFVIEEYEYATPAFGSVPSWLLQAIIPVGFSVMAVRYVVLFALGLIGKRPKLQEPVA